MKKRLVIYLLMLLPFVVWSQTIEVVKIFPDASPFNFSTTWDSNEGAPPGIGDPMFISGFFLGRDVVTRALIILDNKWQMVGSYLPGWGPRKIVVGYKYLAVVAPDDHRNILVFKKDNFSRPLFEIAMPQDYWVRYPILAGDYIFSGERSFMINPITKTYTYYSVTETQQLLAEGLAEQLGIQTPYKDLVFTSRMQRGSDGTPRPFSWVEMNFEKGFYENVTNSPFYNEVTRAGGEFLGFDQKGLMYMKSLVIPGQLLPVMPADQVELLSTSAKTQVLITIIDPYTNRVVFRLLPKAAWTPPGTTFYPLGTYEFFVHPEGHIYFFDGDAANKTFTLKRWNNDWWKELGFEKKQVGIVNANRVRVRKLPSLEGEILSYVYEMEHALVLEKSSKEQTIEGQTAYWYKVRMWDGREGWMFGAFLDF